MLSAVTAGFYRESDSASWATPAEPHTYAMALRRYNIHLMYPDLWYSPKAPAAVDVCKKPFFAKVTEALPRTFFTPRRNECTPACDKPWNQVIVIEDSDDDEEPVALLDKRLDQASEDQAGLNLPSELCK